MNTNNDGIQCTDCNLELQETSNELSDRLACPNCGSFKRTINVSISSGIIFRDGYGVTAKRIGEKRPYIEEKSIPSHSFSRNKLVHHLRTIDRDNDLYHERVTDYESGEIIHENKEPLSQHIGHGSAKTKPNKNK